MVDIASLGLNAGVILAVVFATQVVKKFDGKSKLKKYYILS